MDSDPKFARKEGEKATARGTATAMPKAMAKVEADARSGVADVAPTISWIEIGADSAD